MSTQISIAQSAQDELELAEVLAKYGDFSFHSRIFSAGSFNPKPFSMKLAVDLQCFRLQDEYAIQEHLSRVAGKEHMEQILPSNGLSIEWSRTEWRTKDSCVPGRLYLDDRTPVSAPTLGELAKVMRNIVSSIRKSYPGKSLERHATYVGPDLCRAIKNKEIWLLYAGGKEMALTANP